MGDSFQKERALADELARHGFAVSDSCAPESIHVGKPGHAERPIRVAVAEALLEIMKQKKLSADDISDELLAAFSGE